MFTSRMSVLLVVSSISLGCGSSPSRLVDDNDVAKLKKLIEEGFDVNERITSTGETALYRASFRGHIELVKLLLQHGAKVNLTTYQGFSPLFVAAQENHENVVTLLLEAGGEVNSDAAMFGLTALMAAINKNHPPICKILLNAGANVNARTHDGFTSLLLACYHDNPEILRILLEAGANPDAATEKGYAGLHFAAESCSGKVASLLLDAGAHTEAITKIRMTPLNTAAQSDCLEVFNLLLAHGAKPHEAPLQHVATALTFMLLAKHHESRSDPGKAAEAYKIAAKHFEEEASECRAALNVRGRGGWGKFFESLLVDAYSYGLAWDLSRSLPYGYPRPEVLNTAFKFLRGSVHASVVGPDDAVTPDPRSARSFKERAEGCEERAAYCRKNASSLSAGR
jgi:ankyrin repeat protein